MNESTTQASASPAIPRPAIFILISFGPSVWFYGGFFNVPVFDRSNRSLRGSLCSFGDPAQVIAAAPRSGLSALARAREVRAFVEASCRICRVMPLIELLHWTTLN